MPKTIIYRVPLQDAWSVSILGDKPRPDFKPDEEAKSLEIEYDEAGREVSRIRYGGRGEVAESKRTAYAEDGRPASTVEYFAESESEVFHGFKRESAEGGGILETERILYSGELDSMVERRFRADGTLEGERTLDADGEETGIIRYDGEGRPLPDEGEADGIVTETREEGNRREEIARDADGEFVSRVLVETDAAGRGVRTENEAAARGAKRVTKYEHSYEGDGAKPSLTRVEHWIDFGPGQPPRPLHSGFRMAKYDEKGRPVELLFADHSEGDFEADSYYRIEYPD